VSRDQEQSRLFEEFASQAAAAFEGMTGERPRTEVRALEVGPKDLALLRRQPLSGLSGAIWIAAAEADLTAAGALVLQAAGLAETDPEKLKSEFLEIVSQTVSGLAREISGWLGRDVRAEAAEDASVFPSEIAWAEIELQQGETQAILLAGIEPALADALVPAVTQDTEISRDKPTFDLLLDVELTIGVSFGRAQVPLKDVLKLTTGSIVELNRAIGDPVEVIVNNCVIARGEVVTVEGNFGVRIHQVVSRQERWKTLG
jgi:flagellar motor switch protein FliN